jgi:hypothetical protein
MFYRMDLPVGTFALAGKTMRAGKCVVSFIALVFFGLNAHIGMCADVAEANLGLDISTPGEARVAMENALQPDGIQVMQGRERMKYPKAFKTNALDKTLTFGLVASTIADYQSGMRFRTGEMNPVLGNNKYRQALIMGGVTGFMIYGNHRLRKEGRSWIPRLISGIAIGLHTYVSIHNHGLD